MRPLRFTIFVATTTALLVVAVYLWRPLTVADQPKLTLARPAVASNSVATVEAGTSVFRPPPLRPVRTGHPHRKQPPELVGGPALNVARLVRPPVVLAPKTVELPVAAASGGSRLTISPAARLEHPPSPAPITELPTPPPSPPPREPVPPPAPRATSPSVAQPYPQPARPATPLPVTPPPVTPPPLTPPPRLDLGGQTPPPPTPPPATPPPVVPPPLTPPPATGGQTPPPPPPAIPKVWLGYADTYSPRGSGLPTIWKGSPGVIFVGCGVNPNEDGPGVPNTCPQEPTGGDSYDAGSIRIDNTSATSSLLVSGPASVKIGTCVYSPWPGLKRTISPGGTLILTQTGLSGDPCGQDLLGNYNLDTSESSGNGNCTPSVSIPEITLTINGSPTTLEDSGQILNLKGVDRGACGSGQNEFQEWTPVP
jgi:hypothetical protein